MTMRNALLCFVLALAVTACGKKGSIEPPEDAELYKQTYPAPETVTPRESREDSP